MRCRIQTVFWVLLSLVVAAGTAHGESDYITTRDIAYGAGRAQHLDIYQPESPAEPGPVIIWVHGGAWRIGDKAHAIADKAEFLTAAGYCLVSINYRLTNLDDQGRPATGPPYPGNMEDVAAAVAWVHQHIAEYGGDSTRIILMGHSAGAHLVALLATDGHFLAAHDLSPQADLAAVVCLDTEGYDIPERMKRPGGRRLYESAFGTDPEVWRAASPQLQIPAGTSPPFFVVTRGAKSRTNQARDFADALTTNGVRAELLEIPGYSHMDVNRKFGTPGETKETPQVMAFIASVTGP